MQTIPGQMQASTVGGQEPLANDAGNRDWDVHLRIRQVTKEGEVVLRQTSNPITKDQRFEVWRKGEMIGMATIQKADAAEATLLFDEPDGEQKIESGDELRSDLWRPDRKVRVAIHGDIEPDSAGVTHEQMETGLREQGAVLDDKAIRNTDVVVLGKNLLADEWYRKARTELKFNMLRAKDAVRYFKKPE